jgi:DNA-binding MarR family transcriptional regulator
LTRPLPAAPNDAAAPRSDADVTSRAKGPTLVPGPTPDSAEHQAAAVAAGGAVGAPDLHQMTGYLLRRAFVKAVGAAQACLTADAHLRDALVLAVLAQRGAMSQRQLGEVTGIHQTLVVKLVDGLEATGWVARERNTADRRSNALRLTDAGAAALRTLQEELDEADAKFTAGLASDDTARLKRLLHQLLEGDPSLDVSALSDRAGYLVARAHRSMRARAELVLEPLGLHPRDFGVLSLLARDQPCSQRHLAQRLGVTPPAVLGFVDNLASAGLVQRTRKEGDRRSNDITLTALGAQLLLQAQDAAAGVQADVVRRLGRAGDDELRTLLSKIVGLVEG